ncbi:MAG: alpha/beta fold hydrolase [Bacteroidota bacterium]
MADDRIHIYCMPGMGANSLIFEGLHLPHEQFELHLLDWFKPDSKMSLQGYAKKMCEHIKHPNAVLLGVSFGAMLVQEMAKIISVRKVIVVSSVKSSKELPFKMKFARNTGAHKLLPTGLVNNVELLAKYTFGENLKKRMDLYQRYLSVKDKDYMNWSIHHMVHWSQDEPLPDVVHIHGDKDSVFPIKKIKDCTVVPNGHHAMIVHRAKWFNEHLPAIILS